MSAIPVLTYHSQNVGGKAHADNDHTALFEDLHALHQSGFRVVPLSQVTDLLAGNGDGERLERSVVLTFDDGCNFDVHDLDFPGHGIQHSFLSIMRTFIRDTSSSPSSLHATSFVIASKEARATIDKGSLFGQSWMSDDWWSETDSGGLIAIENHGWDHNHPDLSGDDRGVFHTVDTHEQCLQQVVQAAGAIAHITGRWPRYFAYPFGQSSEYIRDEFFPDMGDVHGCQAAFGTDAGPVEPGSNRWNLPRFVCGRDWNSASSLIELIKAC